MYVGLDPDLHDLAIGYWHNGQPSHAEVIHVKRVKGRTGQIAVQDMVKAMWPLPTLMPQGLKGVAIEAQTLRRLGPKQHKRPEDIVILGNVAGAALGMLSLTVPIHLIDFTTPEEWKGSIPKNVMQARLYTDLGWGYEMVGDAYARPLRPTTSFGNISAGQWKHVGDALLLARWASQQSRPR